MIVGKAAVERCAWATREKQKLHYPESWNAPEDVRQLPEFFSSRFGSVRNRRTRPRGDAEKGGDPLGSAPSERASLSVLSSPLQLSVVGCPGSPA